MLAKESLISYFVFPPDPTFFLAKVFFLSYFCQTDAMIINAMQSNAHKLFPCSVLTKCSKVKAFLKFISIHIFFTIMHSFLLSVKPQLSLSPLKYNHHLYAIPQNTTSYYQTWYQSNIKSINQCENKLQKIYIYLLCSLIFL